MEQLRFTKVLCRRAVPYRPPPPGRRLWVQARNEAMGNLKARLAAEKVACTTQQQDRRRCVN